MAAMTTATNTAPDSVRVIKLFKMSLVLMLDITRRIYGFFSFYANMWALRCGI